MLFFGGPFKFKSKLGGERVEWCGEREREKSRQMIRVRKGWAENEHVRKMKEEKSTACGKGTPMSPASFATEYSVGRAERKRHSAFPTEDLVTNLLTLLAASVLALSLSFLGLSPLSWLFPPDFEEYDDYK